MITPRLLLDYMTAKPFVAFRIYLASGRTFDIRHPEMARVSKSSFIVYESIDEGSPIKTNWREISVLLIESIEPIEVGAAPSN